MKKVKFVTLAIIAFIAIWAIVIFWLVANDRTGFGGLVVFVIGGGVLVLFVPAFLIAGIINALKWIRNK